LKGELVLDQKKLAVIHIVKEELKLSEGEYRESLEKVTGFRSAKDLDEAGFRKLMNFFARSKHYRINEEGLTFRQKIFILGLKEQLQWDDIHFENFLKKYYGKRWIDSLSKKEAIKVIESLKKVLLHRAQKAS
jgi:hypothetical protein